MKNIIYSWQMLGMPLWAPREVELWGRGPKWEKKNTFSLSSSEPVSRFQSAHSIILKGVYRDPKLSIWGMYITNGPWGGPPRVER